MSGGDVIRFRSYVNHSVYARHHGIDYRLECGVDPLIFNKFHYKISIVRRLLANYEWLMWIDDDAYFTDFERDGVIDLIDEAESAGCFLVISEGPLEPNGAWSRINSGVFIVKNCVEAFEMLDSVLDDSLATVRAWWDEERDGLYTNGDQDQLWWYLNSKDLLDRVLIVGHERLNSRMHYYKGSASDNFIMHFCGWPDRSVGAVMFSRMFGLGHDLIPEDLLDEYNVVQRELLSPALYEFRLRKMRTVSGMKKRLRPTYRRVQAMRGKFAR